MLPRRVDYDKATSEEFEALFREGVLNSKKKIKGMLKMKIPRAETWPRRTYEQQLALLASVELCLRKGYWESADETIDLLLWYDNVDRKTLLILNDILGELNE